MNTVAKIAIAAGAGLLAGGVLGILFAPDKGVNTRKKIAENDKKFTDAVQEKVTGLKVNIKNKADAMKEEAQQFV